MIYRLALLLLATLAGCTQLPKQQTLKAEVVQLPPLPPPPPSRGTSMPVWVMPQFAPAYVSPATDSKTGDFVGEHTRISITQEGHWSTQEEAELQGLDYYNPQTKEVVRPRGDGTSSVTKVGKMDVALDRPLPGAPMPPNGPSIPAPPPKLNSSPDLTKALQKANDPAYVEQVASKNQSPPLIPSIPTQLTSNSPPSSPWQVHQNTAEVVVFSGGAPGETHTIDLAAGGTMQVRTVSDKEVLVSVDGKEQSITLPARNHHVRITF